MSIYLPLSICLCTYWSIFILHTDNLTRVRLRPTGVKGADYINASFVDVSTKPDSWLVHCCTLLIVPSWPPPLHPPSSSLFLFSLWLIRFPSLQGYKHRRAYIVTQGPLESTVNDFWRMISEHKSRTIVMLCNLEEEEKVGEQWWYKWLVYHPVRTNCSCACEVQVSGGHGLMNTSSMVKSSHT